MNQEETVCYALKNIGLTPRLIKSTDAQIPLEIRQSIPAGGDRTSFGLFGTTGAGKSCALACMIKRRVSAYTEWYFDQEGIVDYNPNGSYRTNYRLSDKAYFVINWLYWPDTAQVLQDSARLGEDPKGPLTRHGPKQLKTCKVLVIDDLGRERSRPDANGDTYAHTVLESVINHRYEHYLQTLWTSNLDGAALIAQYGAPTIDRLLGLAPVGGWLKLGSKR